MDGGFTDARVEDYLHRMQPAPDRVLADMERSGVERGFPIIGPLVGRLCEQLARGIGAKRVFEMGSGFGYSTVWFARAVGDGGLVVHTDGDHGLSDEAAGWLAQAGLDERVDLRVGDAVALLTKEKAAFDVVFIDIDKQDYPKAWAVACGKVRVGGLVITDNTLWKGKVAGRARDGATDGVRTYNEAALGDERFLTTILPLRDGVAVSLRIK